jgi:hypothetical protein
MVANEYSCRACSSTACFRNRARVSRTTCPRYHLEREREKKTQTENKSRNSEVNGLPPEGSRRRSAARHSAWHGRGR